MSAFLDVFLFNILVMTGVTAVFLLLLPWLRKRYTARWLYSTSLLLLALWIIPFRPSLSLPASTADAPQVAAVLLPTSLREIASSAPLPNFAIPASSTPIPLSHFLLYGWLAGAVILLGYYLLKQRYFVAYTRRWSLPVTDPEILRSFVQVKQELGIKKSLQIKQCRGITSPMLIGLAKPAILLPNFHYSKTELLHVLKHECTHFKQKDLPWRLLIFTATIVFFFHPIVWILAKVATNLCELACDEQVMKGMPMEDRKEYGRTILQMVKHQKQDAFVLSTAFYGGKQLMKTRITSVIDSNQKRSGIALLGIVLLIVLFAACSPATKTESIAGYIVFKDNTLLVDTIEIVNREDTARIAELGLSPEVDMPNGYHFVNDDTKQVDYKLTDKTVYTFTDVGLLFISEAEADGNRLYTTTNKEEFLQHLHSQYTDDPPAQTVPFILEVKDGKVISVREEFLYTI